MELTDMKMSVFREAVTQVVNSVGVDMTHEEIRDMSENLIIELAGDIITKREYLANKQERVSE